MEKIALIAGNGSFPYIFAQAAKNAGLSVIAIAFREETAENLAQVVDKIYWISVGQLKALIDIVQKEQFKKAVMAGQIGHKLLFSGIELDDELKALITGLKDKKTDTILAAVASRIGQLGVEFIDSTTYIKQFLPQKGVLTDSKPTAEQEADISFGKEIAKAIAGLDIGQTVVVKNKVVLSVEAIEGTDEAIHRASVYCKGGAVVIKVSKPNQDMRFDIPLIGKKTIETLIREQVAVLAIEAEKTLFLDREYVLSEANKYSICVVAI
ncbi:MAG: UDP-2,3-diacylglucosamine diphosphatase LpxI [Candidatus Omnitrophica bacterium]|nr:UDP-2,3-diacylglucosamine diphosphatase LpxI [Candidatus Omnitrophota bacterium]MCG2702840.1 UDP-2,3-diacylglucosamine diphosphatase LpxI [Candidatus Omnitrophota bacterium]